MVLGNLDHGSGSMPFQIILAVTWVAPVIVAMWFGVRLVRAVEKIADKM